MSDFIRPTVSVEEVSENVARVVAEPLEHGYGDTLGNSLRRVLLSSLEGAAVEAIQIDGVQHEFTTVEGVYEDVTDIVLNVKGLAFKSLGIGDEATATISIDGPATDRVHARQPRARYLHPRRGRPPHDVHAHRYWSWLCVWRGQRAR